MSMFDGYMAVDWSANATPTPKNAANSIWMAVYDANGMQELENFRTRQAAMEHIEELLDEATANERRLLCGFDFSFGYPEGTAQMLTGVNGWEAVWRRIAEVIIDHPDDCNWNNRFEAAAALNVAFNGEGPFWGRPADPVISGLETGSPKIGWGQNLPPRLRYAEKKVAGAHEVWQLYGRGAVGSQALTGIARLQRLRCDRNDVQVWPFETLGEGRYHVLAEIYPRLIDEWPGHAIKDARQVAAVALAFRELDRTGLLQEYLQAPKHMPARVIAEEGLIFGMQDPAQFRAAAAKVTSS